MTRPLPRSFYARDTLTVARDLLGCILVRRVDARTELSARIVEVEAYVGEADKACHARAGRTPRTDVLYGGPGIAYVYLTYGMHHLLNVVTEPTGRPAAVLIRAAEPLLGLEWMARARGLGLHGVTARHTLASGPAKLCQSFGLDLRHNRTDLCGTFLWIGDGERVPKKRIATSPRIGCHTAPAPWDLMPWRFFDTESRFVTPGRAALRKTRGSQRARHRE